MALVEVTKKNNIAVITMNRPEALNALNKAVFAEFEAALDDVEKDNDVYVVIITGAGRAFIAGADIGEMAPMNVAEGLAFSELGNRILLRVDLMEKPTIAAVNGFALGGGCEMALACDIRLASEKAKFGQPEVGLGITPGFGGTQRMARIIGTGPAMELIYTADTIDANRALEIGMVNHVVPADQLMDEAMKLAEKICKNGENDLDGFVFPSYVEDILGPTLFDFGYGPFRWCCLSRKPEDLAKTDEAAAEYIKAHTRRYQDHDNYVWVRDAGKNKMVVGTQCRILYSDAMGRMNLALKFNEMVRNGEIGPVMLGRDHHDTGGTDSPFRETSNIKDGSNIMADMATQCYAGNAARGMSLIALHNGGGVGVSKSINGGFGMVLDGSDRVDQILKMSMPWDVMVGVARRSWARNENALTTAAEYNKLYEGQDHITLPYVADDAVVESAVKTMKG